MEICSALEASITFGVGQFCISDSNVDTYTFCHVGGAWEAVKAMDVDPLIVAVNIMSAICGPTQYTFESNIFKNESNLERSKKTHLTTFNSRLHSFGGDYTVCWWRLHRLNVGDYTVFTIGNPLRVLGLHRLNVGDYTS